MKRKQNHFFVKEQSRFNPCKGFRCFEAGAELVTLPRGAVSIPVRVLDVLKHLYLYLRSCTIQEKGLQKEQKCEKKGVVVN